MIDATKRAQLIAASTEAKVNAVYGLVENTDYYGIKGNASSAAVKALWDDAVAAGLIASQIDLTATQIKINGDNIYINGSTMFEGEVGAEKIKAALIEVSNLLADNITVKDKGVIHSDNYNGTIDANGNITAYGSAGWAIDHAGKSDFINLNATGGTYKAITTEELIISKGSRYGRTLGGSSKATFVQQLFNYVNNFKEYATGNNIYNASGYFTWGDYYLVIVCAELVWRNHQIQGVIFRGYGSLIIDSNVIRLEVLKDGTARFYRLNGSNNAITSDSINAWLGM
jgi:hypothetical protein